MAFVIALVTGYTFHGEVNILAYPCGIYQTTLVIFFRPDRGRRSRSPFALAAYLRRHYQRFHFAGAGVTLVTTAFAGL